MVVLLNIPSFTCSSPSVSDLSFVCTCPLSSLRQNLAEQTFLHAGEHDKGTQSGEDVVCSCVCDEKHHPVMSNAGSPNRAQ